MTSIRFRSPRPGGARACERSTRRRAGAGRWLLLAGLVLVAGVGTGSAAAPGDAAEGARSPFVEVGRRARESVVSIRTVRSVTRGGVDDSPLQDMFRRFFPQPEDPGVRQFDRPGTGSGFVVAEDGHILTNHHVVAGADAVHVRFSGERRDWPAIVVGSDPNTDLALLKIDADRPLRPLPLGDSDSLEVGDWAIAIGNPFGNLEGSLTVGVISAKGRSDLVIAGGTPRYQDFIQTDASINFGNSGGPLVDIQGRVVGVNTAVNATGQGIGFAIPINFARRIYEQLRTRGRVVRAYLGVRTESDPQRDGALIGAVLPESPAAAGGLREGDLVVEFGGRPVREPRDLTFLVAETAPGTEVSCSVERAGRRERVTVRPEELDAAGAGAPRGEASPAAAAWLGLEVAALNDPAPSVQRLREAYGAPADGGVLVVAVRPDGPAAAAGVRPGDVAAAVDGQPVQGLEDWRRLQAERAGQRTPVELLIRTGGRESYVMVQPGGAGAVD